LRRYLHTRWMRRLNKIRNDQCAAGFYRPIHYRTLLSDG